MRNHDIKSQKYKTIIQNCEKKNSIQKEILNQTDGIENKILRDEKSNLGIKVIVVR